MVFFADARLSLSRIDNEIIIYINGKKIVSKDKNLLEVGENSIVIRLKILYILMVFYVTFQIYNCKNQIKK